MIDVHCHIEKEDIENIDNILNECKKNKINKIIVSGYDKESNQIADLLSKKYPMIYASIGYLPTEECNYSAEDFNILEKYIIENKKIVAVGEIGLDYYWFKDNFEKQKEIFEKQIVIAKKFNLPIIIHSRDSIQDTYDICKKNQEIKKILHCYSGSLETAKNFVKINCFLSVGGIITFKNAKNIIEVIKDIDMKYILTETDSPYLTPEPFRGKRNYPYYITNTIKKIAIIKQIDVEQIEKITSSNADQIFDF